MVTSIPYQPDCPTSKDDDERTLLMFAAKAAGIVRYRYVTPDVEHRLLTDRGVAVWNPLKDDGDALRLAVKLRLDIDHYRSSVVVSDRHIGTGYIPNGDDPYAATRLAIVRAAAEIGKAMK